MQKPGALSILTQKLKKKKKKNTIKNFIFSGKKLNPKNFLSFGMMFLVLFSTPTQE